MNFRTLLVLAALVIGLAVCEVFTPAPPTPNILLISIDTLRADHLGCYGNDRWSVSPSPVIDRLAEQGTLFERCYAPRGQTHPSIASMLTGKNPISHWLRENGFWLNERHTSLIQFLNSHGYATAGFASNLYKEQNPFDPASPPNWWTRGLDAFGDGYGGNFVGETINAAIEDQWSWDERTEKQTLEWIAGFEPEKGQPFFLWTHFYDPHKPYLPHESCPDFYPEYEGPLKPEVGMENGKPVDRVSAAIDLATQEGRPMDPEDHLKVLALYDSSIYGVDQRLDRLLAALHEKGMLENTWIFLTSDHGDELGDHQHYYYHGASIYDAVLHIPLIVIGPGVEAGRRVRSLVQNVDLAPTLLELAGIEPPREPGYEGISLVEVLLGRKETERAFVTAEWMHFIYSYSDGRGKYIFNPQEVNPVKPPFIKVGGAFEYEREELYDLEVDPGETRNLAAQEEETVKYYRKNLIEWVNLEGHDPSGKHSMTVQGSDEAVRSLGYTGVSDKDKNIRKGKPKRRK